MIWPQPGMIGRLNMPNLWSFGNLILSAVLDSFGAGAYVLVKNIYDGEGASIESPII